MKNFTLAVCALLVSLVLFSSANAECNHCGNQRCCYGSPSEAFHAAYCANVNWPKLYIPAARSSVCQTYNAMINNGWRRQNLLGDYHFNPDTNELTDAGKLKVNWILTQAPAHRRNVYVQRGFSEEQTAERIAAVQSNAAGKSPAIGPVNVNDTHIVAEGNLASTVDSVFVGYQSNRPAPVLPSSSSSASSSAGN